MTALEHALTGVKHLQDEDVAYTKAMLELDRALLADAALANVIQLLNGGADDAEKGANAFRAASRVLTDSDSATGHALANEAAQDATTAHDIRREIDALRKRIEEINRLVHAMKERLNGVTAHVRDVRQRGQEYAQHISK